MQVFIFECGSKSTDRRGKPQVLVHVSTSQGLHHFGIPDFLSHSHFGITWAFMFLHLARCLYVRKKKKKKHMAGLRCDSASAPKKAAPASKKRRAVAWPSPTIWPRSPVMKLLSLVLVRFHGGVTKRGIKVVYPKPGKPSKGRLAVPYSPAGPGASLSKSKWRASCIPFTSVQ